MDLENNLMIQDEKKSVLSSILVYRKVLFQEGAIFEATINYIKFLITI